jgi:glycosyltransferase involved in cell wall biosynthesis
MDPMKKVICHLSNFSPDYSGTFIDSLLSLARYCDDKLHIETFCIFPETARGRRWLQTFDKEGVRYAFLPRRRNVISDARCLLRDYDPLIFHTHFFLYDFCAIFLKLTLYKDSKVVWHYHDITGLTLPERIKDVVKLGFIGHYIGDRCIAVGDGVYRSLLRAGFPREKLSLVDNGIDTRRFFLNHNVRKCVRESFGVTEGQTVFLLLGLDPQRKGTDIFVKAALEVVGNSTANSLFLIVGRKETRDFVLKLHEYALLKSYLRVIDPREDFASLLNGIDVLVSASRREAFPYAVAEGLAAEKLILCSDITGMREIYGNSEGVWFFPSEGWKILAELMQRAEKVTRMEREQLGRINHEYVKAHYSLDRWCEKIGRIYSGLLQS